jgi:gas vesicle protein GvpN
MHTDHVTAPSPATGGLVPEAGDDFVLSPEVQALSDRAVTYLEAGYPVHFSGPAGTGKTTMAFHVAAQLGRPVSLVHGSDEFSASDLVGRDSGYRKSSMVDNYISSVLKTEETMQVNWVDNRLTTACERGHTLIYDEFNRSRAEANNTLLSILEEGILNVPKSDGSGYIVVHPEFRLLLTSNPVEYAGVHDTQDALLDRLVTIEVGHYDRDTEIAITAAKSGIQLSDAARLVTVARELRSRDPGGHVPTVRSTIALAQVLMRAEIPVDPNDERFLSFAWDIFGRAIRRTSPERKDVDRRVIADLMGGMKRKSTTPSGKERSR